MSTVSDRYIASTLFELISATADDGHIVPTLELLMHRSVDLLPISAALVVATDIRGGHRILAFSTEHAEAIAPFRSYAGDGPTVDVVASGQPLSVDLATADERWPSFAPAARQAGIGWVQALPVHLDSSTVGSVNLLQSREEEGDLPDSSVAQALRDLVSITLAQERPARRAERAAEHVQQVINEQASVEQVKGMLAAHLGVPPAEAYSALASHARSHGTASVMVAAAIVRGEIDAAQVAEEWRLRGEESTASDTVS